MDPKRHAGKTYSEVMNEWAAQRQIVHGDRSRLLHPPYDAHPVAKLFGYLFRLLVVLLVPAIIYLLLLRQYATSEGFNESMGSGLAATLNAKKAESRKASWTYDGMLTLGSVEAKGAPGAFYDKLEAQNVSTRVPLAMLWRKDWVLPRVSIESLSLALRSGGLGTAPQYHSPNNGEEEIRLPTLPPPSGEMPKTGALPSRQPKVMRAGFGIEPDFANIRINGLQTARLNAVWGSAPATRGTVTGMQTDISRTAAGWEISGNGGTFQQSWLDGMHIEKLAVTLNQHDAHLGEVRFTPATGGKAGLTGRLTLGEVPELTAQLELEGIKLQNLIAAEPGNLFSVEAGGTVKLSGSPNRVTGIRMEGQLTLGSGRLAGLPLLKALSQISGEDQLRQVSIHDGHVDFTSEGSAEHGGLIVEIPRMELNLGPVARLKGQYRQELIRATEDSEGRKTAERLKVSGLLQLGLAPHLAPKFKAVILERYFKASSDGWIWLDLPVDRLPNGQFTRDLAGEMVQAWNTAP